MESSASSGIAPACSSWSCWITKRRCSGSPITDSRYSLSTSLRPMERVYAVSFPVLACQLRTSSVWMKRTLLALRLERRVVGRLRGVNHEHSRLGLADHADREGEDRRRHALDRGDDVDLVAVLAAPHLGDLLAAEAELLDQ